MTYKIYAKKGRKVMPIKLESKHVYENPFNVGFMYRPNYLNVATADAAKGTHVTEGNIWLLKNSNVFTLAQGTGESDRIGNKVNIKGINCAISISLHATNLINYFGHGTLTDLQFKFRIMAVKFKNKFDTTNHSISWWLAKWFRETFIYYRVIANAQDGEPVLLQSNQMDKLRDSTPWTGNFKILKDKKFMLGVRHSSAQFNFNLGPNKDVNFENTNNQPTEGQGFSNTYIFIIMPSNYYNDVDTVSRERAETITAAQNNVQLFSYNANIKTIYYDM